MVTLQSVAKRAGVSTATVSKVLSDTPYVSEETRQKVMQAIEELGYVPNLAARALSSGKTHIIAVVFPHVYDAIFNDPLVLHIMEGVEAECSQQGYNLLLSTPRFIGSHPDDNYHRLLQSKYVDGIVALDNVPSGSVLTEVRKKGIPAVAIGYHQHDYYVRSADYSGGVQLMQHLLENGHQRIGIITVADNLNFSIAHRLNGFKMAAKAGGLDFNKLPQIAGDFSVNSGAEAVQALLNAHPDITAVIGLNDRMAMGAIQQVRRMGMAVPDDLTIVGYDDIPAAAMFSPSLTTINQQAPEIGRIATRMLFDILNFRSPDPVEVPTQLMIRESSAVPPKR